MKRCRSFFYNVFVLIGVTLLLSKILARAFGLKDLLASHVGLIIGYELILLLLVSVGLYCYKRFFASPDTAADTLDTQWQNSLHKSTTPEQIESFISELRCKWRKEALILRSRLAPDMPTGYVSCLGRVTWQLPGEEWPVDAAGNRLDPLATIFVPSLPGVPLPLRQVALITIFAPLQAWACSPNTPTMGFVIRTYPTLQGLVPCNCVSQELNTCILTPEPVLNDMPYGRCAGGDDALWDKLFTLDDEGVLDYWEDVCDAVYNTSDLSNLPVGFFSAPSRYGVLETHKLGGYPTFIQDGAEPEDYPFVLQLNSDSAAGLEIGDAGTYYFFYNAEKNDWIVSWDCY